MGRDARMRAVTPLLEGHASQRDLRHTWQANLAVSLAALTAVLAVGAMSTGHSIQGADLLYGEAPCGVALAGTPCLPGGLPAVPYGSDPMGMEVGTLSSVVQSLNSRLTKLKKETSDVRSVESDFAKRAKNDLGRF